MFTYHSSNYFVANFQDLAAHEPLAVTVVCSLSFTAADDTTDPQELTPDVHGVP